MNFFAYRDHALYCEGVALAEIAARAGTPCYVYSAATILENFRAYDEAFADVPHTICYAVKANGNLSVLRLLAAAGSRLRYRFRRRAFSRAPGRRRSLQDRVLGRRKNRRRN